MVETHTLTGQHEECWIVARSFARAMRIILNLRCIYS